LGFVAEKFLAEGHRLKKKEGREKISVVKSEVLRLPHPPVRAQ